MPFVHNINTRIRGRGVMLLLGRTPGRFLIPNAHQQDGHSCGFLAALVAAQYFEPTVSVWEVLEAMPLGWQPSPMWGLSE